MAKQFRIVSARIDDSRMPSSDAWLEYIVQSIARGGNVRHNMRSSEMYVPITAPASEVRAAASPDDAPEPPSLVEAIRHAANTPEPEARTGSAPGHAPDAPDFVALFQKSGGQS